MTRWILAAVAVGGALGALARYGLMLAWPTEPGAFPWRTFAINVVGCFAIGALMVLVTEVRPAHPLVRPILGTGVLGGFTTFSTYAEEVRALLGPEWTVAVAYLAGTVPAALVATVTGTWLARLVALGRRP
ncbi:fluoride efflux transporter CrcB [Actinophytocola sp.]|uniref:fluoride efflux transporter CrcB n=1 Tax=Actinophytocola sp. TaxID=1872138 RepID=UPI003D6C4CFC